MARRLNFGCGADVRDGWTNVDIARFPGADVIDQHTAPGGDWQPDPLRWWLPYGDGCFDLVVANHSLCAIEWIHLGHWLGEIRRVLRFGGVLRVLVPDVVAAFNAWAEGRREWFPHHVHHSEATVDWLYSTYLTWFSENRSAFTARALLQLVDSVGFEAHLGASHSSYAGERGVELDNRISESLIVEGVRRA